LAEEIGTTQPTQKTHYQMCLLHHLLWYSCEKYVTTRLVITTQGDEKNSSKSDVHDFMLLRECDNTANFDGKEDPKKKAKVVW
jgi:hypothetical protein